MNILWTDDPDWTPELSDPVLCTCPQPKRATLRVEEGSASVVCRDCGEDVLDYVEDVWVDVDVLVTIETCDNPGGWHGMERCDCGPTVEIVPEVTP